jgi:3-phosphoshikimate 1-carboxyvinyltransferase
MSNFIVKPSSPLLGVLRVPGDKSISHRCIMFGALANGITEISGFLEGEDALATLKAFQDMGVKIERNIGKIIIYGVGMFGLSAPKNPLDLGNSGTAMRLMLGILAAQDFDAELVGDTSLSARPMGRVIVPLTKMGAVIQSNEGKPPLKIKGGQTLSAIDYTLPVASAQVKSCILLAGLYAQGQTCIDEGEITRDHTERMLKSFNYPVNTQSRRICIQGGGALKAHDIQVPSDISSAAFFIVAGLIAPNSNINIERVNINPTRTGVIDILKLMGGDITLENQCEIGGELVADIRVKSSQLCGIEIPKSLVPLAIDEFPVVFIAASCAKGETHLSGARELRVKESDRIQVMADGLDILGISNTVLEDGIKIQGGAFQAPKKVIKSHHDHRISMAFAVVSCACQFQFEIEGVDNVKTSFPNFVELANLLGMQIKEV